MSLWDDLEELEITPPPPSPFDQISDRVRTCQACSLCTNRRNAVPGSGREDAPIFVIAEKPGKDEDASGVPMVGQSGTLFTSLLARVGLKRSDCYITNRVRCKPAYKERLTTTQLDACQPYLEEELAIVRPRLILCLGNLAASLYWPPSTQAENNQMGAIHGRPLTRFQPWGHSIVLATYHPVNALPGLDPTGEMPEVITRDLYTLAQLKKSIAQPAR